MREHVDAPRLGQLDDRIDVVVPDVVDRSPVPLGREHRVAVRVEEPRVEPVHRAEQHVERVPVEERGHLRIGPRQVVDLESDEQRQAARLRVDEQRDVVVEVRATLSFEHPVGCCHELVAPGGSPKRTRHREHFLETVTVLGDRDLLDADTRGLLARGASSS